jgi:hypothetical protein
MPDVGRDGTAVETDRLVGPRRTVVPRALEALRLRTWKRSSSRIADAHEFLAGRGSTGKIVVNW